MTNEIENALGYLDDMKSLGYTPMTMAAFFQHYEGTIRAALEAYRDMQWQPIEKTVD